MARRLVEQRGSADEALRRRQAPAAEDDLPAPEGLDADWIPRRGDPSPRWGAETEDRTWTPG